MASLYQLMSGNKPPEKSSFALTCNLLSQYMKERGGFGDIGLGVNRKLEEAKAAETSRSPANTLNLLPSMESLDKSFKQKVVLSSNSKSMDLFPQFVGFSPLNPVEDTKLNADLRKSSTSDPVTAPMTIVYGGKMIVFNDFPAGKVKEITALVGKGGPNAPFSPAATDSMDAANSAVPDLNSVQERGLQAPPKDNNGSDLPMARRASLHRFFAKRKERAAARAPYLINDPSSKGSQICEKETSKLSHLELKL